MWSLINGTLLTNLRVRDNLLIFDPFTKRNAGIYECLAYNIRTNQQMKRRIHLNSAKNFKPKPKLDVSKSIHIKSLTPKRNYRRNRSIRLKCIISKYFILDLVL